MALSEFGDVSQVVSTGLALAALGTAAEQYIIQNLMGNRRVILSRQDFHEDSNDVELKKLRSICSSGEDTPEQLITVKDSLDRYDQEKEDLSAIDVQESLKIRLIFSNNFGWKKAAISATYIYIAAAVIYSVITYFSGIHLTEMVGLFTANKWLLNIINFPYTIDALLNVSILTLTIQTMFFARFMWKSIRLRSRISNYSENLRSLGESIIGQAQFASYLTSTAPEASSGETSHYL